jgi:hypothetical protein
MAYLYISSQGDEITRHSYSAGLEFDQCPFKFFLKRILGWREKDTKASLMFGRALESAVEFYHTHEGKGAVEEFIRLWAKNKANDKLVYTDREDNWESLLRAGTEMLRLYAIRQPGLPIPMATRFQREFVKEVFPLDDRLGGIEFYGKLDALPQCDPHHPLLPKVKWDESRGLFRPLIVDIKTSGIDFDQTDGIVAQDLQLRMYAWLTGIYDVSFLWFKKAGHGLRKATGVTLLEGAATLKSGFTAGDEVVVAELVKENPGNVYIVKDDAAIEEMNNAQGRKASGDLDTTNAAKERKANWLVQNAILIEANKLTRQRLQFSSARVDPKSAEDAGHIAANQIARIVSAWESNKWTNTFGIRFPHDDRQDPFFKAFVLKDNVFRDAIFEQKNDEYFDDEVEAQ